MPLVGRNPRPNPRTEAGRQALDRIERGTEDWDHHVVDESTTVLDLNLGASELEERP